MVELFQHRGQVCDRPARDRIAGRSQSRCEPALPDHLGQGGVRRGYGSTRCGWHQLSHDALAIGDQDNLTRCGEAYVLTEAVLEDLQSDSTHERKVASRGYFVNHSAESQP